MADSSDRFYTMVVGTGRLGEATMSKVEGINADWTTQPADDPVLEHISLVMAARSMIVARRALEGPLPPALIADPVVDVLMALYVAHADGRAPTASEMEGATTVSPGVTRRWLAAIAAEGLIAIDAAGISLTAEGNARVTDAIRAVVQSQRGLHGSA